MFGPGARAVIVSVAVEDAGLIAAILLIDEEFARLGVNARIDLGEKLFEAQTCLWSRSVEQERPLNLSSCVGLDM